MQQTFDESTEAEKKAHQLPSALRDATRDLQNLLGVVHDSVRRLFGFVPAIDH